MIRNCVTTQDRLFPIHNIRAIDGDCLHAHVALPFEVSVQKRIRLKNWFADELVGPHSADGYKAQRLLQEWCRGKVIWIAPGSIRCDRYGRIVASLWHADRLVAPSDVLGSLALTERIHAERLAQAKAGGIRHAPGPVRCSYCEAGLVATEADCPVCGDYKP